MLGACGGVIADESTTGTEQAPVPGATNPEFPDPGSSTPASPPQVCSDRRPNAEVRALHGLGSNRPYPPRTLYSYTTAAQVAGLRQGEPLFSKVTTDSGHRGYLFDLLTARAQGGDEVAALLAGPMFEKGRFAWPFLAGTRISPETYGDEIVAMTLRPEAVLATVTAQSSYVAFYDSTGQSVDEAKVMARPELLGAIYFVNDEATVSNTLGTRCVPSSLSGGLVYREFYLGNIDMVEEWSLGTQAILDHLADEVADLRAFAKDFDCPSGIGSTCNRILPYWEWQGAGRVAGFLGSLAFTTPEDFVPADIARLADDLDSLRFTPDPLIVRP